MNAPELMSETPATLFEDAAFNLIKAISPVKNIRKDVVPYEEIKDFISNFIQNKTGESNGVNEEIAKETNEDDSSRLSATSFLQDDTTNQSFNSEIFSPTKNAHLLRLPKSERKLVQVRQRRRQAYETKEFFPLECNEPDLLSTFQSCYQRLITGNGTSAIHCFHVIKNSLTQFFSNNTWAENVQKLVAEFLGRALLKTTDELCAKNERKVNVNSSPSNIVLEYELMCLVEIFLLSTFPKPLAETNIVAKLRFIYFASSAEHMKKFVDETLCDEFAHILPFYMTGIYEELCMDIPVDLEKYESSEHKLAVDYRFDLLERQSKKRHANIEQLITEDNSSTTSDNDGMHSFPRRSSRVSLNGEFEIKKKKNHENGLRTKNNIIVKPDAKRIKPISYLNIPETPEFKMNRKRPRVVLKSTEKDEEDVVQQTPIRKIAKSSRRISERLEKLLKETNQGKKTLRSQVTVKQSHLSMEIAVNKRKPHVDLRERFSTLSSTTKSERSSILGSPRKSDRSSIMESPTKKSDSSPNRTIISSVSSNPRKKASMELDDDILKKYRSRMSVIRQNSKRSNTHEVFYGRSNPRSNLFAEEVGSPESASPHVNSTSQKNRSGRSVKQNDDRVYIAHTLLNVHNQRPLSPFKLVVRGDQKFPFKVRKLLRHTTFSKLKRLRNLTRKTQLNLSQQVASV